jgi:hypothetical protein
MSGLHCPARLVLVGAADAIDLDGRRIAAVYAGPGQDETARRYADRLGVRVSVVPGLPDLERAVPEIGDLHPGETVLVVAEVTEPLEIEYDGDGWAVVRKP